MSVFHSMVSRRDFMKGLGLAGAGLGAATAMAPVFTDLDEMKASSSYTNVRPWWVKESDKPTVDVDWSMVSERFECVYNCHNPAGYGRYFGYQETVDGVARASKWKTDQLKANAPGYRLRDSALANGAGIRNSFFTSKYNVLEVRGGTSGMGVSPFAGPKSSKTPELLGVPKYTGTPEENSKMIRAALKLYGAQNVGFAEVTAEEKKLFCHSGGRPSVDWLNKWPPPTTITKPIEFTDAPVGYQDLTTGYFYVPKNTQLYEIVFIIPMSVDARRTSPSNIGGAGCESTRYPQGAAAILAIQEFIWSLGYNSINDAPYPLTPSPVGAILTGLAEQSREQSWVIGPEHGPNIGIFDLFTDLPLAPTKPINAGTWRFCQTCKKCAETCPSGAISQETEPSWEPALSAITPKLPPLPDIPSQNIKNPGMPEYHRKGAKALWIDFPTCNQFKYLTQDCNICMGVCTMNVNKAAMVHQVVHGLASTTGVFNGFLWNMGKTFKYNEVEGEDKEKWWDLNLPSYGTDNTIGVSSGKCWSM